MTAGRKSPAESIVDAIARGLPGQWSADFVHGLLPEGWRLVHGPRVQDDLEGGLVLTAGADGPRGEHAGAKVRVLAERLAAGAAYRPKLIEDVLGELALALRNSIDGRAAPKADA